MKESLKPYFSRSLQGGEGRLHLAAHSHHLWPDVSYAAHLQAWEDAARLWDAKWDRVFDHVIPVAQSHLARHLNIPDPGAITFAPNTHEFVQRIFSCLPLDRTPRVLSSDSEFHSFSRQAQRLAQDGVIELHRVPTAPFADFVERFAHAAQSGEFDLIFVSQVFFNSSFAIADLDDLVQCIAGSGAIIVIDGYHGFMARPTDLSRIWQRAFYLAGGYKYAMAGEGVCFMHCPPGIARSPRDTGWFASFGTLDQGRTGGVPYAADGGRFLGATFDPTGLHRLNAVMHWLDGLGLEAPEIHARAHAMQYAVMAALDRSKIPGLRPADLLVALGDANRGNFLAFDSAQSPALHERLRAAGIVADLRGSVLRLGFGLYHDLADAPAIAGRIAAALA